MKHTDDYNAKLDFWARNPQIHSLPYNVRIPGLTRVAFRSYAEFNQWKRLQLLKLASLPPEQWQIKADYDSGTRKTQ